jgi:hypothetical protein
MGKLANFTQGTKDHMTTSAPAKMSDEEAGAQAIRNVSAVL